MRIYDVPQLDTPARPIEPQEKPNELTPATEVTIIFRGGPPIVDMYDSRTFTIPPKPEGMDLEDYRKTFCPAEHFKIGYSIAQHLQARAIVPGTRNRLDYRKAASQLGILNIDKPEYCVPFTPEQLERFGGTYQEGIDREGEKVEYKSVREINQKSMVEVGVDLDAIVNDAAAAEHGEEAVERRDRTRVSGGAGVAAAQAGEMAAASAGRKNFSPTKPGRVDFKDKPTK